MYQSDTDISTIQFNFQFFIAQLLNNIMLIYFGSLFTYTSGVELLQPTQ